MHDLCSPLSTTFGSCLRSALSITNRLPTFLGSENVYSICPFFHIYVYIGKSLFGPLMIGNVLSQFASRAE